MEQTAAQQAFTEALSVLTAARAEIIEILAEDGSTATISLKTGLDRMVNQLNFLTGNKLQTQVIKEEFKPVTDFMGSPIVRKLPVDEANLSPKELERQQFIQKVNDLEASIDDRENKDILDSFSSAEDQLVIRGVAKRAGLDDYKTAEINADYLDMIREGLEENADAATAKANDEKKLTVGNKDDDDLDS